MSMRIAILIKQVPVVDDLRLTAGGHLQRAGVPLEMNAYCRRAVSKGVELARTFGGTTTALTMGPPSAEDSLREAIAWGADHGVLISDAVLAGSDTYATARALSAALTRLGPWDLVLTGRNSIDGDTGQVGPAVAQMLSMPFLAGVRKLSLSEDACTFAAESEADDGFVAAEGALPIVLSCAERLCEPSKVPPAGRAAVPAAKLRHLRADDLGAGPWGELGSPTKVERIEVFDVQRERVRATGDLSTQVDQAVAFLSERGALNAGDRDGRRLPPLRGEGRLDGPPVAVLLEPDRDALMGEFLGAAARLAETVDGHVGALATVPVDPHVVAALGADRLVQVDGALVEEDVACGVIQWARQHQPWAVLAPSTLWGREVLARVGAELAAGLTGDAIDLTVEGGRLVARKPAFGGSLVASITASSPIQMATVRPGVLERAAPRTRPPPVVVDHVTVSPRRRLAKSVIERNDQVERLARASCVIGVGVGVSPNDYHLLDDLRALLDAELGATRKVTDQGWLPRARQIGVTGRSIAPDLYVALGLSGKLNHLIGVRRARTILAVNCDGVAPVFDGADIGIVGEWKDVVPLLAARLRTLREGGGLPVRVAHQQASATSAQ